MEMNDLKQELTKRLLMARFVWVALTGSVFIYIVLAYALQNMQGFKPPPIPPPAQIGYILMLAGIMSAIGGVLIARGMLPFPKARGGSPSDVMASLFTGMTVACALCETAAVMGLVMFFLWGDFRGQILMSIVSVVGMTSAFPTESKYIEAINKTAGPGGPALF